MLVVIRDPVCTRVHQLHGTGPVLQPEAFLFEGPHKALRIGVAFRVVIAGKGLVYAQGTAGLHKGARRWLTAVIPHEGQTLISRPIGELPVDGPAQRLQPLLGRTPDAGLVAHDRFGIPLEHHHDINPTDPLHQDFGHVDAPPLVGLDRSGLTAYRCPLGLQRHVRGNQPAMLPHPPQPPFLVHRPLLHKAQIGPHPAIAPKRMLRFQRPDSREEAFIPLDHLERPLPPYPSSSSLFVRSSVSSSTSCFSRAFSGSRCASFRVY
mgnify:CR=1 FL=1